jgi:hypothetical protein
MAQDVFGVSARRRGEVGVLRWRSRCREADTSRLASPSGYNADQDMYERARIELGKGFHGHHARGTTSSTNHLPYQVVIGRDMIPHAELALTSRVAWLRGWASLVFARTCPIFGADDWSALCETLSQLGRCKVEQGSEQEIVCALLVLLVYHAWHVSNMI